MQTKRMRLKPPCIPSDPSLHWLGQKTVNPFVFLLIQDNQNKNINTETEKHDNRNGGKTNEQKKAMTIIKQTDKICQSITIRRFQNA